VCVSAIALSFSFHAYPFLCWHFFSGMIYYVAHVKICYVKKKKTALKSSLENLSWQFRDAKLREICCAKFAKIFWEISHEGSLYAK
jgi:hypothetical protein